jgi:hypothetical protein
MKQCSYCHEDLPTYMHASAKYHDECRLIARNMKRRQYYAKMKIEKPGYIQGKMREYAFKNKEVRSRINKRWNKKNKVRRAELNRAYRERQKALKI